MLHQHKVRVTALALWRAIRVSGCAAARSVIVS